MTRRSGPIWASAAFVAAVITAAFLWTPSAGADPLPDPSSSPSSSAPAPPAGPTWGALADDLLARATALDDGTGNAYNYASMAYAVAHRSADGWHDQRALAYLAKMMQLRNADGGWGLGKAYDAFSDGSVNPATTTYTVTLTVHVGMVLVDAYTAGAVPASVVTSVTQRLYAIPRITVAGGYCVPYSDQPADRAAGYCVHNVNAGVAMYLRAIEQAGLPTSQLWMTRIMLYESSKYDVNQRSWRYFDSSPNWNDHPHNALNYEAMLYVGSAVGRDGLLWYMARDDPADPSDVWLHLGLAPYACPTAAQWLPEVTAEMAKPANQTFNLLAQAARSAARASNVCDGGTGQSLNP